MPKVENPITGKKFELTNWKGILGMVVGGVIIIGIVAVAYWGYTKLRGIIGAPQSGSTLKDVLDGI